MAAKVDEEAQLPVAVEKEEKKAAPFPAVQLASLWALLTAAIFFGSLALAAALVHYNVSLPSWLRHETELTAAEERALARAVFWYGASASAAATAASAALLLPDGRGRSRRALAYAALAATAAAHVMLATVVFITTDPAGSIFWWIESIGDMSFLAAGDVVCLLALLGRLDAASASWEARMLDQLTS